MLEDGIDLVNRHEDDPAIKVLTKANNLDPRNGDVAFWLFTAYKEQETTPEHPPDRASQSYLWAHQVIQRLPQTTQADTAQKFIAQVEDAAPSDAHGSLVPSRVLDVANRCIWLGFSPTGKTLATLSSARTTGDDASVQVFDVDSGKSWSPEATNVAAVAFSPDGRKLVTSGDDTTLWDVETHKPVARLDMGTISIAWVDEKTVAAAIDNSVLLYLAHSVTPAPAASGSPKASAAPAASPTPAGELKIHFQQAPVASPETNVVCLAVSPNHKLLATASQEEIKLWDVHSGEALKTLPAKYTASMKFSRDGDVLVTAGRDRTIRFWDIQSGKPQDKTYEHTGANFFNDAFGWVDGLLASAVDDEVKVWDLKTGDFLHAARTHTHGATACDFSPDGKILATTGDDGKIQLWEVKP
jgi:WD40 repeat protein